MSCPHRAPIGALRTQAGVKRSETPVKRSRQQNRVPKERQKFCRPYRGFNMFMHPMQGFRFAPPPACVLSPLSGLAICSYILCMGFASLHHLPVFYRPYRGLQSARTSFAGVSLRCTTCLCSVRPYRGFNMLIHPLQGFRYALPPACNPNAPIGASICSYILCRGFASLHHLPVILTPLSGLAITIRINMMPMSMLFPYEL